MDKIEKIGNLWRSVLCEKDARKCHTNMSTRLPLLSLAKDYKECCAEWSLITGHKEGQTSRGKKLKNNLCLCGQMISDEYYFMNGITKEICVMGCKCCERVSAEILKAYKESLKKKGKCWLCDTNHKDLETHYASKNHGVKLRIHMETFINVFLVRVIRKKLEIIEQEKHRIEMLKDHRMCIGTKCQAWIKNTEPEWKIRCIKCYKIYTEKMK